MVRATEFGAVVLGPKGVRYLDQDRVEGEDPTTLFGPHTIMSLKREDAMEHAPDLLLISQYDPELGEVAAFEELIGSHGGLGGPQTEPFILHPVEWKLDEPVPLGAPAIYRNIRAGWGRSGSRSGPGGGDRRFTRSAGNPGARSGRRRSSTMTTNSKPQRLVKKEAPDEATAAAFDAAWGTAAPSTNTWTARPWVPSAGPRRRGQGGPEARPARRARGVRAAGRSRPDRDPERAGGGPAAGAGLRCATRGWPSRPSPTTAARRR